MVTVHKASTPSRDDMHVYMPIVSQKEDEEVSKISKNSAWEFMNTCVTASHQTMTHLDLFSF
jgi:hypothetical protein